MACQACGRTHDARVKCVDVWIGSAEESASEVKPDGIHGYEQTPPRLTPRERALVALGEQQMKFHRVRYQDSLQTDAERDTLKRMSDAFDARWPEGK